MIEMIGEGRKMNAGATGGSPRRGSGELSGLVLEVLRQAGRPLTAAEVQQRLAEAGTGSLAYTTVVTILSRLYEQATADRFKTGRAFAYQAVTDPAKLAARRMRRLMEAEDDRTAVLTQFVGDLDPREEQLIRELLGTDLPHPRDIPDQRP